MKCSKLHIFVDQPRKKWIKYGISPKGVYVCAVQAYNGLRHLATSHIYLTLFCWIFETKAFLHINSNWVFDGTEERGIKHRSRCAAPEYCAKLNRMVMAKEMIFFYSRRTHTLPALRALTHGCKLNWHRKLKQMVSKRRISHSPTHSHMPSERWLCSCRMWVYSFFPKSFRLSAWHSAHL